VQRRLIFWQRSSAVNAAMSDPRLVANLANEGAVAQTRAAR